jgi:Secretion system C-terminal sorting domain
MTSLNSRIVILVVILLTVGIIAFAQFERWGSDEEGVPVRLVNNIKYSNATAQDNDGNIAVLWKESDARGNRIVAQCFDSNNQKLWGEEGKEILFRDNNCIQNDIVSLNDGTWIVVTMALQNSNLTEISLRLQRIDGLGDPMWSEGGVAVTDINHASFPLKIFPSVVDEELEGLIVSWKEEDQDIDSLFAQKFDLNGIPQWEENGLYLSTTANYSHHYYGRIPVFSDNSGGLIVCWYSNILTNQSLNVQRVSNSGETMWEESSIIAETNRVNFPCVVSNGNNGFYLSWLDDRQDDTGYSLYAQYLDPDGNKIWSEENEIISNSQSNKWSLNLIPSGDACIAVWSGHSEEYMQKFSNIDSSLNIHWGGNENLNGVLLSDDLEGQMEYYLTPDENGGFVACWREPDADNATQHPIKMQWIDGNGNPRWESGTASGLTVGRVTRWAYNNYQDLFYSIHVKNEEVALIWNDQCFEEMGVLFQKFSNTGSALFEDGGVAVKLGDYGRPTSPSPLFSGNNIYFGWQERFGWEYEGGGIAPYIQKVDPLTGLNEFEDRGISLIPGYPEAIEDDTLFAKVSYLDFIPDQQGGVIASWNDRTDLQNGSSIRAQRITPEGDLLWGDFGAGVSGMIGNPDIHFGEPIALSDDNGGAFLVFDVEADDIKTIAFQHIDQSGIRLLSYGDLPYINLDIDRPIEEIFSLRRFDNGTIIVLYIELCGVERYEILKAVLVNEQGDLLIDEPLQFSSCDDEDFKLATLQKVNGGFIVTWIQNDEPNENGHVRLNGQMIRSDGTWLWPFEDGKEFARSHDWFSYSLSAYGEISDSFWLCWLNTENLKTQRYNLSGEELLNPVEGIEVVNNPQNNRHGKPHVIAGQHGDAYISWQTIENRINRLFTHLDSEGQPFSDYTNPDSLFTSNYHPNAENIDIYPYYQGQYSGFIAVWEGCNYDSRVESNVFAQLIMDEYTTTSDAPEYVKAPIPEEYVLHSAYPNPFNPTSVIAVGLPVSSDLKVKVYNMLGKEVATLVDGKCASGYHAFQFDASDLASGVYFVKAVVAGKMNQTQKIILMK